ncbi:hypothetical protein NPIL_118811, partial [Nephila pilipes]
MSSNITTLNRKKGNIKAQITKLSNWKETNDPLAYCRSKFTCITCKSKHHSLLHRTKLALRGQRSQDPSPEGERQTESSKTPSEEDFFHNAQSPRNKRSGSLSQQELQQGKRIIIHAVQ